MLLAEGGAAFEVGPQAGDGAIDVGAGEFQLDVAVELVEASAGALVAGGTLKTSCRRVRQRASGPQHQLNHGLSA